MIKKIIWAIWILLLIVLQISFIPNLDFAQNKINLLLISFTFFLLAFDLKTSLIWAIIAGYFLDYYSNLPFGVIMISLIFSLSLIYLFFHNFLTNRSLLSLATLVASFTFLYNLIIYLASFILERISIIQWQWQWTAVTGLLWQTVANVGVAALIFLLYNFFSQKFKKSFMVKGNF